MNRLLTVIAGAGFGAAMMFVFDRERGRRRRAMLRDQARHAAREFRRAVDVTARDLRHRTEGTVAGLRARWETGEVADDVLAARVRSRIGRAVAHPGAIEVEANERQVTLKGPVLAAEVERLLSTVGSVPGVASVENRLEVFEHPDDIPALQGEGSRAESRFELWQRNWAPAARFMVGTAGSALTLLGWRRGGRIGTIAAVVGLAAFARAYTNIELGRLVGLGGGRRAIDIHKTINIHAPVEQVYRFLTQVENLPKVMSHLNEVKDLGGGRSRWVVAGPGGLPLMWESTITEVVPNRKLAWRSEPGSAVGSAGVLRFDENPDGSTRLDLRMSYNPPAGAIGHAIASLFGADPKHALDDDMVRLKSLMEHGKTTAHGHTVTREDLAA